MSDPVIAPGGYEVDQIRIQEQLDWAIKNNHAHCYVQIMTHVEGSHIMTVKDLFDETNPTRTVTNDVEYVTYRAWNASQHHVNQPDLPIIYCDSEGNWDELRHREGYFVCFRELGTKDLQEACNIVIALHQKDLHPQRKSN